MGLDLAAFKFLKIQRVVRKLVSQVEKEEKDLSEELDRLYLEAKLKAFEENTEKAGEENGKGEQTSVKELEEKLDQLLAKLDGDLSKKLMADWNGFKENIEKAGGGDEELEGMLDEQLAKLDEEARGDISALPRNDDLVIRDFIILGMVFGILFWDIIFELYLPL